MTLIKEINSSDKCETSFNTPKNNDLNAEISFSFFLTTLIIDKNDIYIRC